MPYARLADETRIYYELTGSDDGPVVIQFGGGLFGRHNFGAVNDGFREAGFRLRRDPYGTDLSINPVASPAFPPTWSRGRSPPRAGRTEPSPADPEGWTTTSLATSRGTSVPRSWAATSSGRSVAHGKTSTGRDGGETHRPSTPPCSS